MMGSEIALMFALPVIQQSCRIRSESGRGWYRYGKDGKRI